jgi:hypothetical protein
MTGSALFGLFAVQQYVRRRSFETNYFWVYLIRLLLGVVAGVLLANLGLKALAKPEAVPKLGPWVIALLGGYSADAVRRVLDRLVEIIVTAVGGTDTSAAERLTIAKDLLAVSQVAAADSNTPSSVKQALETLMSRLQR